MTVKEIVTNEIIKKLEKGTIPWHKPWQGGEAVNYVTQKPYSGINRLLLDGGEYITFKQATERGGKVKKGAKAKTVVFYKDYEITDIDADGNEEKKIVPVLRYYKVFSLTDVEGLESKLEITERPIFTIDRCENLVNSYIGYHGIEFDPGTVSRRAYYRPCEDKIVVPNIKQHDSAEEYYSTLFHEMVHSTGHPTRLCRFKINDTEAAFGSETYSREELVAEIGSAFLIEECGISSAETLNNSAGYIQSWIKALRDDSNAILYAAAKAEKAVELIKSAAAAFTVAAV